jgi:hypothetical protein
MYLQKEISKRIIFCWRVEGHCRKEQDAELDEDLLVRGTDPDSYLNDTDPDHCFPKFYSRLKITLFYILIHSSACLHCFFFLFFVIGIIIFKIMVLKFSGKSIFELYIWLKWIRFRF